MMPKFSQFEAADHVGPPVTWYNCASACPCAVTLTVVLAEHATAGLRHGGRGSRVCGVRCVRICLWRGEVCMHMLMTGG